MKRIGNRPTAAAGTAPWMFGGSVMNSLDCRNRSSRPRERCCCYRQCRMWDCPLSTTLVDSSSHSEFRQEQQGKIKAGQLTTLHRAQGARERILCAAADVEAARFALGMREVTDGTTKARVAAGATQVRCCRRGSRAIARILVLLQVYLVHVSGVARHYSRISDPVSY